MANTEIVRAALERYFAENGFTEATYDDPTVAIELGPFTWRMPNSKARRRAIPLHDLHHVATGYGTDLVGEAEIGVWELRAGCDTAFLWWINLMAVLVGLLLAPRRIVTAFRAARGARSLYVQDVQAPVAWTWPVDELREAVGIPRGGLADPRVRRLHRSAPGGPAHA